MVSVLERGTTVGGSFNYIVRSYLSTIRWTRYIMHLMFLNQLVPNKVTHCSNGGVAILTALTSKVTFNLTVQVVYLRNMTNGLGCN